MKLLFAVTIALTTFSSAIMGQNGGALASRYGSPDAHDQYTVRPDIGMKVEFDEDGQATRMIIKPLVSEDPSNQRDHGTVMPKEVANQLLEEMPPRSERGSLKRKGAAAFGCTTMEMEEYEHRTITTVNRCEQ